MPIFTLLLNIIKINLHSKQYSIQVYHMSICKPIFSCHEYFCLSVDE